MDERKYTQQEMTDAERLIKAITTVPDEKRQAFIRVIEAMIMGGSIAERLSSHKNAG